ncbi:MAG TPA: GNAT family protein [Chitinophagaceae bacterium]|nr:GNAT family protein [Chitinophagaceae bacterium]
MLSWVQKEKEPERFLLQWSGTIFKYPLTYKQLHHRILLTNKLPKVIHAYIAVDEDKGVNKIIGYIELDNIRIFDGKRKSAYLSRVIINPDLCSQGYGNKMLKGILKLAFIELKLYYVYLYFFEFNMPARRCYERNGFTLTSEIPQKRDFHNENGAC